VRKGCKKCNYEQKRFSLQKLAEFDAEFVSVKKVANFYAKKVINENRDLKINF
jgi:hypothetical protein